MCGQWGGTEGPEWAAVHVVGFVLNGLIRRAVAGDMGHVASLPPATGAVGNVWRKASTTCMGIMAVFLVDMFTV